MAGKLLRYTFVHNENSADFVDEVLAVQWRRGSGVLSLVLLKVCPIADSCIGRKMLTDDQASRRWATPFPPDLVRW